MIKVGDRVRGWANLHRQGPMREGEVIEWKLCGDVGCVQMADGARRYIFVDTAELLSSPLPLPAPIDWGRPLRTVGGLQVDFVATLSQPDKSGMKRVVCIHGPEGGVVHTVKENGQLAIANTPGRYDLENVPPPKLKAKRTIFMISDGLGGVKMCSTYESMVTVKNYRQGLLAICEVELVEGEGMNDSPEGN